MYAVFEADGVQYKVSEGETILIDYKKFEKGTKVSIPDVLLVSNGEKAIVGKPYIENASIDAEFVGDTKGKKIIVFKKKRRKGYSRKRGHRQKYSLLKINKINVPEL